MCNIPNMFIFITIITLTYICFLSNNINLFIAAQVQISTTTSNNQEDKQKLFNSSNNGNRANATLKSNYSNQMHSNFIDQQINQLKQQEPLPQSRILFGR